MIRHIVRYLADEPLKTEYGLTGSRLLPWTGASFPFGGAYCVVAPRTESMPHVNSPDDEEELFIGIAGRGEVAVGEQVIPFGQADVVLIRQGLKHYLRNPNDEPLQFYTVWWNHDLAKEYLTALVRANSGPQT